MKYIDNIDTKNATGIGAVAISSENDDIDRNNLDFYMRPDGYISFDDAGKILISSSITETDCVFLNINERMNIILSEECIEYIKYHRKFIFDKEESTNF